MKAIHIPTGVLVSISGVIIIGVVLFLSRPEEVTISRSIVELSSNSLFSVTVSSTTNKNTLLKKVRGQTPKVVATSTPTKKAMLATTTPPKEKEKEPVTTPAPLSAIDILEAAVHERINAARSGADIPILAFDTKLAAIARKYSEDMAKNDYFDHVNLSGCSSSCRLDKAGYSYQRMGENIYLMRTSKKEFSGAPDAAVAAWLGSSGHRANIMNAKFALEGIGIAIEGNSIYVTEMFATK